MTAMSVMGVDGGGSKTLIALADASGTVTRLVGGGGINPIDNPLWLDDFGALFKSFGCDPAVVARGVAQRRERLPNLMGLAQDANAL